MKVHITLRIEFENSLHPINLETDSDNALVALPHLFHRAEEIINHFIPVVGDPIPSPYNNIS
jgi:hypothetical protein